MPSAGLDRRPTNEHGPSERRRIAPGAGGPRWPGRRRTGYMSWSPSSPCCAWPGWSWSFRLHQWPACAPTAPVVVFRTPGHVPVHGAGGLFRRPGYPHVTLAAAGPPFDVRVPARPGRRPGCRAQLAGGAARWLGSGSFQFQPSELAKLALILFAADVIARRQGKRDWIYRAGLSLLAMGFFVLLIMKQPDMGTAVVLCCCGAAVLFAGGMPLRPMVGLGRRPAPGGFVLAGSASYRSARLAVFLDPFAHASTTGYQSVQGLIALGAGTGRAPASARAWPAGATCPTSTPISFSPSSARRPASPAASSSSACSPHRRGRHPGGVAGSDPVREPDGRRA